MSVIRIKKARAPYVTLNTTALNDRRLSFKAKGLHTYLMSKPDNWQLLIVQLEQESPTEGRDAIRSGLQELIATGYIRRARKRGTGGRMAGWDSTVYETPELADADAEDSCTDDGLSDIGLAEVGSTEVGQSAANYSCIQEVLNLPKTEKNPPVAPLAETRKRSTPHGDTSTVLAYFNRVHGRSFETTEQINRLLQAGVSLEDCTLVIDWLYAVERLENPEGYERYVNNVTPFRPQNFDRYRDRARRWKATNRPQPTPRVERLPL